MTERRKPGWLFEYAPLGAGDGEPTGSDSDLVLATLDDVDPAHISELIGGNVPDLAVTPLVSNHPVFWTRIESSRAFDFRQLVATLDAGGIGVRYVTSSRRGHQRLPPPLDCSEGRARTARDWPARTARPLEEVDSPWRWFLRGEGADVDRAICGTGAGTRLAVIDDDGRDLDKVELDAEVAVGVDTIPRAQAHAAIIVGWAVGARREDGGTFAGVAPDASTRVYCIPKPGVNVWSLPLAILRAVEDGADAIVCATYVEGGTSPLLDDALEVASRLGRRGRGTAVVMPTGREMSSRGNSVHSSLSLGMADPASDPRVFCVGPSARDGRWFLWRDRKQRLRPFANRGPAVRFLAPGDDMAYPFASGDRASHAESSGACAIAGAVMLLALEANPELTLPELDALLRLAAVPVDPALQHDDAELADRRDLEPLGVDPDGHNAKHGYGRVSATLACLVARDPVAQGLVRIGERQLATRYVENYAGSLREFVGERFAREAARAGLRDPMVAHALCSLLRALRLTGSARFEHSESAEPSGQYLRQVGVLLRLLERASTSDALAVELRALEAKLRALDDATRRRLEAELVTLAREEDPKVPSRIVALFDGAHRATKTPLRHVPNSRP